MFTKLFHNKLVYQRRMTRLTDLISNVLNGGGGGITQSLT